MKMNLNLLLVTTLAVAVTTETYLVINYHKPTTDCDLVEEDDGQYSDIEEQFNKETKRLEEILKRKYTTYTDMMSELNENYTVLLQQCLLEDDMLDKTGLFRTIDNNCSIVYDALDEYNVTKELKDYLITKSTLAHTLILVYTNPEHLREKIDINTLFMDMFDFNNFIETMDNKTLKILIDGTPINHGDKLEEVINKLLINEEIYETLDDYDKKKLQKLRYKLLKGMIVA